MWFSWDSFKEDGGLSSPESPIATKIAAKLAVGYLLDELKNDITRETPARPVRECLRMVHVFGTVALSRGELRAEH